VPSPKAGVAQLKIANAQVRAGHAARTAIGRGCGAAPAATPFWLYPRRSTPSEADPAAAPPEWTRHRSGGCALDQAPARSEKTPTAPPGSRMPAPEPPFRWRGRGTAAPWRGLYPRSRGAAPPSRARDPSRERVAWGREPCSRPTRQTTGNSAPCWRAGSIRVTRLASVSLLSRSLARAAEAEEALQRASSFSSGYWRAALTAPCRLRRRLSPHQVPSVDKLAQVAAPFPITPFAPAPRGRVLDGGLPIPRSVR